MERDSLWVIVWLTRFIPAYVTKRQISTPSLVSQIELSLKQKLSASEGAVAEGVAEHTAVLATPDAANVRVA